MTIREILVPTDGSNTAVRALGYAIALADRTDARIHIVNVEEREPQLSEVIAIQESDILADLHADLSSDEQPVDGELRIEAEHIPDRTVQRTVVCPSAARGILTYADEHDIDVVVIGTHGRSGIQRAMMGSVAEEVVRKAHCPVLSVCPNAGEVDPAAGLQPHLDRILTAVDLSPATDLVIDQSARIAELFGADVELLHIVERVTLPPAYGVGASSLNNEAIEERAARDLEKRAGRLGERGIDTSVHVVSGHASSSILARIDETDPDLVVLGTHGFTGVKRVILGSVAEQVVRRAPCPVLTTRTSHREDEKASGKERVASKSGGD